MTSPFSGNVEAVSPPWWSLFRHHGRRPALESQLVLQHPWPHLGPASRVVGNFDTDLSQDDSHKSRVPFLSNDATSDGRLTRMTLLPTRRIGTLDGPEINESGYTLANCTHFPRSCPMDRRRRGLANPCFLAKRRASDSYPQDVLGLRNRGLQVRILPGVLSFTGSLHAEALLGLTWTWSWTRSDPGKQHR